MSTSNQASYPDAIRGHEDRLRDLEGVVGRWIYVRPIEPATIPPAFNPLDPLSPIFENSWENGPDGQPLSFRIHPATKVQIRSGALVGGTIPSIVFTLPVNYRPLQGPAAAVLSSSDGTTIFTGRIDQDGSVWLLAEMLMA